MASLKQSRKRGRSKSGWQNDAYHASCSSSKSLFTTDRHSTEDKGGLIGEKLTLGLFVCNPFETLPDWWRGLLLWRGGIAQLVAGITRQLNAHNEYIRVFILQTLHIHILINFGFKQKETRRDSITPNCSWVSRRATSILRMNDKNRDATCDTDIATQVSECTSIQKNENCIRRSRLVDTIKTLPWMQK